MIISLCAGGMTARETAHHLESTLGVDLSPATIGKITDAVAQAVLERQDRPLEDFYPVIYLDAIRVKVRADHRVTTRSAHIAVGVGMEGVKHVLGTWVQDEEGGLVRAELANRGVQGRAHRVTGGLAGLPAAIEATWPGSLVPTCVVHLTRASTRFVAYQDPKRVAGPQARLHGSQRGGRPGGPCVLRRPVGPEVPRGRSDLGEGLGTAHPVPGLPSGPAPRHLHHQRDRVAELPAAQGLKEPGAPPLRRGRRQAAVAGHLRHRGQARPPTRQGAQPATQQAQDQGPPHPGAHNHQLETGPCPTRRSLPRPH